MMRKGEGSPNWKSKLSLKGYSNSSRIMTDIGLSFQSTKSPGSGSGSGPKKTVKNGRVTPRNFTKWEDTQAASTSPIGDLNGTLSEGKS